VTDVRQVEATPRTLEADANETPTYRLIWDTLTGHLHPLVWVESMPLVRWLRAHTGDNATAH
jgi:hypothetical protein